jgi:hypothetical protein
MKMVKKIFYPVFFGLTMGVLAACMGALNLEKSGVVVKCPPAPGKAGSANE